jgi:hypothetical protein
MAARRKQARVTQTQMMGCFVGSMVALILYHFIEPAVVSMAAGIGDLRGIGAGLVGSGGCLIDTTIARRTSNSVGLG